MIKIPESDTVMFNSVFAIVGMVQFIKKYFLESGWNSFQIKVGFEAKPGKKLTTREAWRNSSNWEAPGSTERFERSVNGDDTNIFFLTV